MTIQDVIMSAAGDIEYATGKLKLAVRAGQILNGLELIGISDISIGDCCGQPCVNFYMEENADGQKFAHVVAQFLGIKLDKDKSWRGDSLVYSGSNDAIEIRINGVIPKSCVVEEIEVPLTDKELIELHYRLTKATRTEKRIICGGQGMTVLGEVPEQIGDVFGEVVK